MPNYTRLRTPVLIALAMGAAACGGGDKNAALTQDSSLSRDLAMAGKDSAVQPQLQDVPANTPPAVTTPPVAATPTPTPTPEPTRTPTRTPPRTRPTGTPVRTRPTPPPEPRPSTPPAPVTTASGNTVTSNAGAGAGERSGVGTIAEGSSLELASNSKVCTNTNSVGEQFSATVANAVTGSNGATIPAGATATLEITQLKRSENSNDKIQMGFRLVSVTFGGRTYQADATTQTAEVTRVRNEPKSKDIQKVGIGAVAGGVLGRVLGGGAKGAIIGAAAGAAAGGATAAATANYEGCLNSGGRVTVQLSNALQVRI